MVINIREALHFFQIFPKVSSIMSRAMFTKCYLINKSSLASDSSKQELSSLKRFSTELPKKKSNYHGRFKGKVFSVSTTSVSPLNSSEEAPLPKFEECFPSSKKVFK